MWLFGFHTYSFVSRYQKEIDQWKKLVESTRLQTEKAKEGYAQERHLDFLKLSQENVEPLTSYLTAEQLALIQTDG